MSLLICLIVFSLLL
ncbi:MAG: hypothetical protein GX339_07835 [Tissierellia bacterium]|nr:hypothetical protein [Tissierellia bacterium]